MVLLNVPTDCFLLCVVPPVPSLDVHRQRLIAVEDGIPRLANIISAHIVELHIAASLHLQHKGARAVDVHIFQLYTENFALDEGHGGVGGVDDVTVLNVNVGVNLLVDAVEPEGTDAELPVGVGGTGSQKGVSVDLCKKGEVWLVFLSK